jgi:hypothetical protein
MLLIMNSEYFPKQSDSKSHYDPRSVSLGVKPDLGPKTEFILLSDSCGFVDEYYFP